MPWHNLSSHLFSISSHDAAAEVELGEEACTLKLVQQLIEDRDGKLVPYSPDVEGAIVDAEQPNSSFLRTSNTITEKGDMLGLMMPWHSMSSFLRTSRTTSSCLSCG
jgi:hypothetical protein